MGTAAVCQPPYPQQPAFAPQPGYGLPGYGPMAPPPQGFGGPPGFQPNLPPPNPYPPLGPPPPLAAPPTLPPLPEMVYLVAPKFWFRPDVLLWWTKTPTITQPLITTGSSTDSVPGAIGQPNTQVLVGGGNASFGYIGGVRFETGVWLDDRRIYGLEAGYFVLIQQSRDFTVQSGGYGYPLIARPTMNAQTGNQGAYLTSLPDAIAGGTNVVLKSEFQGANVDGSFNLLQTKTVRLDALGGFRYLSLAESLNVADSSIDLFGNALSFGGAPLAAGDALAVLDRLHITNSFYGGSGGARLYYASERWFVTALGKVALGTIQERATLSGSSTLTNLTGVQTTLPGGIVATTANIGSYYQKAFAVAPEGQFNFGYQITPLITLRIGYTFIYLSNVARPGQLYSRVTSPGLVPSNPGYGSTSTKPPPFQFQTTSYWAQGLNFGMDVRF